MTAVEIGEWILPWPTSLNHLYPSVGTRRVLSRAGRLWKDAALIAMRQGDVKYRGGIVTIPDGPLSLTLWLFPATTRSYDLDGKIKLAMDTICTELGFDDSRITELHGYKLAPVAGGRLVVRLDAMQSAEE